MVLLVEICELLLIAQRNGRTVVSSDPRVLEGSGCIVPLRRREGTQSQEKIFCEGSKVQRKFPVNRLVFNILELLNVVLLALAWSVAWMLSTCQKLVCNYATCPEIDLF